MDELKTALLIVALIAVFWFRTEGMLEYGDTPIKIGSPLGMRYTYSDGKTVITPNSLDARQRLFNNKYYDCNPVNLLNDVDLRGEPLKTTEGIPKKEYDNTTSGAATNMHMKKAKAKSTANKKIPPSPTATRENMCSDKVTRIPMPSY